jgi:hypothetical protein
MIFHAVVDLPAAERAARLNELCSDDSELRAFVERLLPYSAKIPSAVTGRRQQAIPARNVP